MNVIHECTRQNYFHFFKCYHFLENRVRQFRRRANFAASALIRFILGLSKRIKIFCKKFLPKSFQNRIQKDPNKCFPIAGLLYLCPRSDNKLFNELFLLLQIHIYFAHDARDDRQYDTCPPGGVIFSDKLQTVYAPYGCI